VDELLSINRWTWVEQLFQDARYAIRRLCRDRAFAAAAILTLAIAVGMSTAIFSVFNAVVLRSLDYPTPDRLIWLETAGPDAEPGAIIGPDFVDWRNQAASFDRMVGYGTVDYTLSSTRGAARVRAVMVTEDFWDLAGARVVAGRLPRADERDSVLLSQPFAAQWFAGRADLVGSTVALNGRQATVVGILPAHFRFQLPGFSWAGFRPADIDVYQPMIVSPERSGMIALLNVVGRLEEGATLDGARAELEVIRARIARAHPNPFDDHQPLRLVPLHEQLIGRARWALFVLLGAVGFVLLIACGNVANLLLARASVRRKEIAVRMSMGASRSRVLGQLLVESLVLAVLGSAAGLLLARLGVTAILRIAPHVIPRLAETTIDGRVLAAVLGTCVLIAMAFGLAPAFALWRTAPHDALKSGSRSSSPRAGGERTRRLLVAGEVALALTLLIGAGLMLKSAWRMHDYPPGFEPGQVLTAKIEFAGRQYTEPHRSLAMVDALLERLRSEPAVDAASISTHGYMLAPGLDIEGEPVRTPEEIGSKSPIMVNATTAALRPILGFRMVRGQWFTDGEAAAVLNESLARREFGERDPIGRRIRVNDRLLTIVGVAADVKYSRLDQPAEPEVYVPYQHVGGGLFGVYALISTTGDPVALAPSLRGAVAAIDATQVPADVMTLERWLSESIAPRRLNMFLLSAFAGSALLLAIVGIYGVMAYSVAQRVHEIGVRLALGARRIDVARMIVRQGAAVTTIGIVAGVAGAFMLTRLMESLLYEVQPTDPWTFSVVTAALAVTSLVACALPALKAAWVDPSITLRDE
jgi:putative ABC transport system permease protein